MNDLYSDMVNIAKIRDGLFIGDIIAGTTIDLIYEFKISHMINSASNQMPSQFSSIGVKYLNFNWPENPPIDKPLIKDETVTKIVNFIDTCLKNGDGLLIYSVKGQNRCCVVIILYLMKKYFWSLEKSKQYLLSKKQDIKITKNFMEQLLNYENHLNKLFPNKRKSTNWNLENIKDNDELLMANTYINEVELAKKKNIFSENKQKNRERHVGWADDKKNLNIEQKLLNLDIENDLYFKRNVKDITSHINYSRELKSIIKYNKKVDDKSKNINNNENEIKNDLSFDENKEDKMEFFNTKNILRNDKENNEEDIKEEKNKNKINIEEKDKNNKKLNNELEKENNINLENNLFYFKESYNEIKMKEEPSKNNNKMKLNFFKNSNEKEQIYSINSNKEKIPINIPIKDYNKMGQDKGMNINFNNINIPDLNKKYYNNFISSDNNKKSKINNNVYSIYLKNQNKGAKKSRSTSKMSHNNNLIPFIEYNQNNNIITNIMINHNPQLLNNNQKLFVKFNKDNNNIINNNSQFIQNNNFININYFPQGNESKSYYI
jgi:hypothetical protein